MLPLFGDPNPSKTQNKLVRTLNAHGQTFTENSLFNFQFQTKWKENKLTQRGFQ